MPHLTDGDIVPTAAPIPMGDGWLIGFVKLGGMRAYACPLIVGPDESDAVDGHDSLRRPGPPELPAPE